MAKAQLMPAMPIKRKRICCSLLLHGLWHFHPVLGFQPIQSHKIPKERIFPSNVKRKEALVSALPLLVKAKRDETSTEEDLTSKEIHMVVKDLDPEWYDRFVVQSLGAEFCQQKWTLADNPKQDTPSELSGIDAETEVSPETAREDSSGQVEKSAEEASDGESTELPFVGSPETIITSELEGEHNIDPDGANFSEETDMSLVDKSLESDGEQSLVPVETEEVTVTTTIEDVSAPMAKNTTSDTPNASTEDDTATINFDMKSDTESVEEGNVLAIQQKETSLAQESKKAQVEQEAMPLDPGVAESVAEKSILNTVSDKENVIQDRPKTSVDSNAKEPEQRVAVYQDTVDGWKATNVSAIEALGYTYNDLLELESDALSIIMKDAISRPSKLGLPSAWKRKSSKESSIQIVSGRPEAEELLQRLKSSPVKNDKPVPRALKPSRVGSGRQRNAATAQITEGVPQEARKDKIPFVDAGDDIMESPDEAPAVSKKPTEETPELVKSHPEIATASGPVLLAEKSEDSKTSQGNEASEVTTTPADGSESGAPLPASSKSGGSKRVVLYRNFKEELTAVPLSDLEGLGYDAKKVVSLKSEVVALVVTDKLEIPKLGIPGQWIAEDDDADGSVEILDDMVAAEVKIEESKSTRRGRRIDRNARSVSPRGDMDPREKQKEPREKRQRSRDASFDASVENDKESGPRRKRRSAENISERQAEDADDAPRRIYNARTQLKKKKPKSKPDPPDPNSPLWMNMDTFRSLMRNEAALRLRFLGEHWAPTIKQESDWRMNLYKDWLWTLHDGVGESIVPPSRYERARKQKERIQREEDSMERRRPKPKKRSSRS